jgi:uncharacterized membrane protein
MSLDDDTRAWLRSLPLLAVFLILGMVGGGLYLKSGQPAIGAGVVMLACLMAGAWLVTEIVAWFRGLGTPTTSPPHQHPDSDPDPESEA